MDLEQRIGQLSPTQLAILESKLKRGKPISRSKDETKRGPRQKCAPSSFSQERLWFLQQMEPDSCIYNLPAVVPLRGTIKPSLVEQSLGQIVGRHSALRTRFVLKDSTLCQVIGADVSEALDFSTIDLRVNYAQPNLSHVLQVVNDEILVPFNLITGPLLRVRLILQPNNENFLLVVMHHIICDGWSINIFIEEFSSLYESACAGTVASLPMPQQYVEYACYQRQLLEGNKLTSLVSYWRRHLDGAPPVLGLPVDRPRPARQSFRGAIYPFAVSRSSLKNLKSLCREWSVVPFMILLSAFKVLLFRYTNQSKIVVGTPIANRNRSEDETVIGFFTNTLALCSSIKPEMSFRDLVAQVRDTTLGAYEHQELPFEKVVSELQPERSLSYNPVFQVMFTFQNLPAEKSKRKETGLPTDQPAEGVSLDIKLSKFDLTLAMTETCDGLSSVFEYATDLFDVGTIERMADHLVNILEHVLQNPDEEVAGFSFLSRGERKVLLEDWNDTNRQWPEILPLHGRFEKWAQNAPNSTAVIFQQAELSYKELDRRANRIARLLRSQHVNRGQIVGICLPRCLEMVIGLFAILKAGAAYMPIDPEFPEARIAYMLDDAKVSHVLTTSKSLPVLLRQKVKAIALDELESNIGDVDNVAPSVSLNSTDLAYVIFTSGSTGQPKGVMISHGAIYNRLQWMQEEYNLTISDRVMQKTPFTFDVSIWEFFWPLSEGACLVVAEPERHKEAGYLVELIKKQRVTCLHFVPSMLPLFLHEDLSACDSLTRIICSGEALTVEQCQRLQALPRVSSHNLYGPTEAAVDVTYWDCEEWRDQYISVPIGRPIANTQIYILNEKLQPAPIGVPGELYIGGHNLAEGYLNKPELTQRQFITNPFAAEVGARLYKTGDLARFRSDGNIEYIGRMDSQVKLRGVRIEMGEIESLLCQYPGVAEAIVVVNRFDDYDERLVAYVVLESPDRSIDTSAVNAFLGEKLPSYMVPSMILILRELPLTPNGKVDRKRLPEPTAMRVPEVMEPVNDIEQELLSIWRKFLRIDALKTTDNFFALGGHSILATRVINSINDHYHVNVPIGLLFQKPTVKLLAKALSECEYDAELDGSMAILERSSRRLLYTLDQLSEEQVDDLLMQHLDDNAIAGFDDVQSLLKWSRKYVPSKDLKSQVGSATSTSSLDFGFEAQDSAYIRCYLELARTKAWTESAYLQRHNLFSLLAAPDGTEDAIIRLREHADEIFASYARDIKNRLSKDGSETLAPAALKNYCSQLIIMADLALSMKRP